MSHRLRRWLDSEAFDWLLLVLVLSAAVLSYVAPAVSVALMLLVGALAAAHMVIVGRRLARSRRK